MQRLPLRFVEFYFSIWARQKILKHEFRGINGDQANSGLLMSHNLSKDKLWNRIYLLYSTPIRNDVIVKLLSFFWSYSVFGQIFVSLKWSISEMHFHYIKGTFTLKATYLAGFANLKVRFLFCYVLWKIRSMSSNMKNISKPVVIIVGHYSFINLKINWKSL